MIVCLFIEKKSKQLILVILFSFLYIYGFCQIGHIEPLIGKYKNDVEKYFDSLNNLKNNPSYKIVRDVNTYGDVVLAVDFALQDEQFYKCYHIAASFQRSSNGDEICTSQLITGSTKFVEPTLSFIKDNFQFVDKGKWQRPYSDDLKNILILATFERKDGDYPAYIITFKLQDITQK